MTMGNIILKLKKKLNFRGPNPFFFKFFFYYSIIIMCIQVSFRMINFNLNLLNGHYIRSIFPNTKDKERIPL